MRHEKDSDLITQLRESADDFLHSTHSLSHLRGWIGRPRPFNDTLWTGLCNLGWSGLLLREGLGGSGLDIRYAAQLCEVMGQHLFSEPYVASCVMPTALINPLADEDARPLAQALLSGERLLCPAWQEVCGQMDLLPCTTTLRHNRLYGRKRFLPSCTENAILLVLATVDDQVALVAVDAHATEIELERYPSGNGQQADVTFSGAPLLFGKPLLVGHGALAAWSDCLAAARIAQAALLAGQACGCLERTLKFVSERRQFNRPIGAFQSVQHRCVDLHTERELAGASWQYAAECHVDHPHGAAATSAICAAKARCGDTALEVARQAIQLHGAMGFAEESDIGLFLRAAHADAAWLGSSRAHRRRFQADVGQPRAPLAATHQEVDSTDPRQWSDEQFRIRLRTWLTQHYPATLRQNSRRPYLRLRGDDLTQWLKCLARDGWRAPGWPREYGGMGVSFTKQMIYQQEMERAGVGRIIDNGETQLGPTLIKFGTEAQKRELLPRILACDDLWCQGYSEPGAGSDLASLNTRARLEGDHFIVDGQKIWTTHAEDCTHIYALVRTGTFERKQQGISFLLIDLDTPGVTIRPIPNIAAESEFCEVFFDKVRVPATQLVGELHEGWTIAKALLGHERIWLGNPAMANSALRLARHLLAGLELAGDQGFSDTLGKLETDLHDYLCLYASVCDQVASSGQDPGANASILKVYVGELLQRVTAFCVEIAGEYGGVVGDIQVADETFDLHWARMMSLPVSIYAGANEVQRDIIARQVLLMPGV
ncbi:acyl-CoA dehydrogenase [Pseudomonas silvicola]|nr:acyl-CoA dehydrogenase [Pseudomonas silvicola]